MGELIAVAVGSLLLIAALVKGGTSTITWLLFRLRLTRVLTACLVLLFVSALLIHLADEIDQP
ncbi:hypothetical protein KIF24_24365 [Micromonospora sp. Llam7]|uniref:hypothetical protein n=1 Tax=Micromonospora tarapacensis TaxID=2835305 RepID=UPI001C829FC7|nr:hypothetical protein [Micromonospora tarapacensis]MBX7268847.1 hypothetical protein [Micromonospora tarapacensis]